MTGPTAPSFNAIGGGQEGAGNPYNQERFQLGQVHGHKAPTQWFEAWAPHSELHLLVAKPVLSVCATGPTDTERVAKPLKRHIKTKERSRLSGERAKTCLCTGVNLPNLQVAPQTLGL